VKDVRVGAYSVEYSGAPDLAHAGGAATDVGGNYGQVLLLGVNYQIIFTPPLPAP